MRVTAVILAGILLLPAWGQQTSISGTVTDSSRARIPGAIVRATPRQGGAGLSVLSSSIGAFQFPGLAANEYVLRVESPGFTPAERTVSLLVGSNLVIDFQLKPAEAATTVNVTEEITSISVTTSQVGGNVDPAAMKDVPLNGRNWLELSLLVPGVTQNSVGTVPLGSNSSGKFQLNIDGQQVTQNSAGAGFGQPQYSREAISQFQIITNRFDATLGRSAQIQVNAETKSGSNEYHGAAYGYFRHDSMNAADKVAGVVLPFSDQQFGGAFGGPLIKDKFFFFTSYERERQPATIFTQPIGFEGQSFTFDTKEDTHAMLTRFDYQLTSDSRLSARVSVSKVKNPFTGVGGTVHPSRAQSQSRTGYGFFGTWSKVVSASLVNEAKIGFNHFDWERQAIVESQEYRFSGLTMGGPYNYPQNFNMDTWQYRDDLYWMKGGHSVKGGAEFLRTTHTGIFQQNLRGTVAAFSSVPANLSSIFPVWNDPATWDIDALSPLAVSYVQGFGNFDMDIPRNIFGLWIQDDWKLAPKLTLNLGLRYDVDKGVWDSGGPTANGLVKERSGDNNNIAPRIGFAYDLLGDRKTVIRGGAGLYYADIQANQVIDQQIFNGERSIQAARDRTPSNPINLRDPFDGATGEDFVSGAVPVGPQAVQPLAADARTPYSFQTSLGVERQLFNDWTLAADYVHWRVYYDWMRFDSNVSYDPATGFNTPPSAGRPNPLFTNIQEFRTPAAAGALYDGLHLDVKKRLSQRLSVSAAYTLARLKDSSNGPFYYPNNLFDPADEWAMSGDDQRSTLNLAASYQMGWGIQGSGFYHYGSGSAFSTLASGSPFGAPSSNRTFRATQTVYNDPARNHPAPLAAGYMIAERNQFRGLPIHRIDARLSKTVSFGERWRLMGIVEAFNLFNRSNYGSYSTTITSSSYGRPAQNLGLAYAARMMQLAVRLEF